MKQCTGCLEVLPLSAFTKASKGKGGLASRCKRCLRVYYDRNKEKIIERHRARRRDPEHRAKEREWSRGQRRARPLKRLLSEAKSRARARGLPFDLVESELYVPTHCPVLGIELIQPGSGSSRGWKENSWSLDRVDPRGGYTKGNVIIVSWRANRLKNDATLDELEKIVNFYRAWREKHGEVFAAVEEAPLSDLEDLNRAIGLLPARNAQISSDQDGGVR